MLKKKSVAVSHHLGQGWLVWICRFLFGDFCRVLLSIFEWSDWFLLCTMFHFYYIIVFLSYKGDAQISHDLVLFFYQIDVASLSLFWGGSGAAS